MTINSIELNNFRKDLAESLKTLEEKYGISLHLGNISYSASEFHGKLEAKNKDSNGQKMVDPFIESIARMVLKNDTKELVLPTTIINSKIMGVDNKIYTIETYNSRSHKYPWVLVNTTGTKSKAGTNFFKRFI
jgi:hypothetical protein